MSLVTVSILAVLLLALGFGYSRFVSLYSQLITANYCLLQLALFY